MTDWLITYSTLMDEAGMPRRNADVLLSSIRKRQESFLILSEETRRSAQQIADHMNEVGFDGLLGEDLYLSMTSAIDHIARTSPEKNRCSYIGTNAMRLMLERAGFVIDHGNENWVFVGCDRTISMKDCSYELSLLKKGAEMICPQDSALDPEEPSSIGPGSICHMLEYASGKKALRFGFPQVSFIQNAMRYLNADEADTMLIGTDLKRELIGGIKTGIKTIYVMNGCEDLEEADPIEHPTYYVHEVGSIFR